MNCPKCENLVEADEVIAEESKGATEAYWCEECEEWVKPV